ncbi:MAG: pyridoxine 5'-phosphate synthase [Bacteroidetes bacterium]|nr:pyridoxine 5'-phosphate synthase [Bacteroidota bacterium]
MTKLSVNINKIALIRNSRGGNNPDILAIAKDLESWGANGITVHPRPDERHIRFADVAVLKEIITTELNVEGNPTPEFMKMVLAAKPHQVTLVPDAPNALTSNAGWDTLKHKSFLTDIILELKSNGIRTSVFVDTNINIIEGAVLIGTDRIELYTEAYAHQFLENKEKAIVPYKIAAEAADELKLGINAGHDLNLVNLHYFYSQIPTLLEVSIGHSLVCDALYLGLQNTLNMYLRLLAKR